MELDMVPVLSLDPIPDTADSIRTEITVGIHLSNPLDFNLDLDVDDLGRPYIAFRFRGLAAGMQTGDFGILTENVNPPGVDYTATLTLIQDASYRNPETGTVVKPTLKELEELGLIELGVISRTFHIRERACEAGPLA